MKRLPLALLLVIALSPVASEAATGGCAFVPYGSAQCTLTASTKGHVAYVIQGAIEVRITHLGSTWSGCVWGTGAGYIGPQVLRGDQVVVIKRTGTTMGATAVLPGNLNKPVGRINAYSC